MKNRTLIPVLLLTQLLITASVSACGSSTAAEGTVTTDPTEQIPQQTAAETEPAYSGLEAVDGGGAAFRVLTSETDGYSRLLDDISAEAMNGEILNDKIFERNRMIQEKYNVVFEIEVGSPNPTELTQKFIQAGEDAFEMVLGRTADNVSMSAKQYFYDLAVFPNIDLSASWWNRTIMDDMSIYDRYYVGINDMTVQAYYAAGAIYYNKMLASQYDIGDPYELVRSGVWTFDIMTELCRNVSMDLNGNGQYDEKDQYGITYNNFAWQLMFYGIGETFIKKGTDGTLYLDQENEKIINYLQKMLPSSQDQSVTLYSENYRHLGGNYRIDLCKDAFLENRALFWLEALYGTPALRNMETDFGLLPMPKYDAAQEQYYSFIHYNHSSSLVIPVTVPESRHDLVGRVAEDMAWLSSETVRPAFIEATLKGKYSRDNESADMIDYIINGIRMDYALLLNAAGLDLDAKMRTAMDQGSTDIASIYTRNEKKWNAILEKYCGEFFE